MSSSKATATVSSFISCVFSRTRYEESKTGTDVALILKQHVSHVVMQVLVCTNHVGRREFAGMLSS